MRSFKVPFDVSSEEKIFKGILSLRQMAYMVLNIICLALIFIKIPLIIKIFLILILVSFFSLCAFLQIDGIYFDKYLTYFIKYKKKNRTYLYKK